MTVFDHRSGGHRHRITFVGFIVTRFFLATSTSSGTQFVGLERGVLFRLPISVLLISDLIHLVFDPFLDHVLLVVVHEPVDVCMLTARHPVHRAVYPRLAGRFPVIFFSHQYGSSTVSPALGYARSVDPPLFGPFFLGRRLRISNRRRPCAAHAVRLRRRFGRGRCLRRSNRHRPLGRRRSGLTLAWFPEQFVQRMTPVFYRWQTGYVHGRMFTVRLFAGPHVNDRVGRLFAARRFHITRSYAVLNFRLVIARRSPATAGHADKLTTKTRTNVKNKFNFRSMFENYIHHYIMSFSSYLKPSSTHSMYPGSQLHGGQRFRVLLSGRRHVSDHCRVTRQRVQTLFQKLSELLFSGKKREKKNVTSDNCR